MAVNPRYNFDNVKKITVIGGCESGVGAAILAKDQNIDVLVSDFGNIPEKYRLLLQQENIRFEEGGHTLQDILAGDLIIKSPGVPLDAPVIKAAVEKNIPVVSEIEFAGAFTNSKMICITGSNGKTTTTLLTYHILRNAGIDAGLAGNVGNSLALQVARDPHKVYVIELSSFQLDNMYRFKADIAILLNITPDHLDRYNHEMQNYIDAKFRILRNQTPEDYFIYWQDDPVIRRQLEKITPEATVMPFGEERKEFTAAYTDASTLVFTTPATSFDMRRDELSLPGIHNLYNSMAAGLAACLNHLAAEDIRKSLSDFAGVEHRLEFVDTVNGVKWINDSKATNVNSCWYALDSMRTPVVLILGGKDKGNDYSEILPLVKEKVRAIVAMGLHNEKIIDFFSPEGIPVKSTDNLADAVAACRDLACAGDTVLLSPCCASFDLFKSYEDRGRRFKQAVKNLTTD